MKRILFLCSQNKMRSRDSGIDPKVFNDVATDAEGMVGLRMLLGKLANGSST